MFDSLKKKLKEGVKKLSRKVEGTPEEIESGQDIEEKPGEPIQETQPEEPIQETEPIAEPEKQEPVPEKPEVIEEPEHEKPEPITEPEKKPEAPEPEEPKTKIAEEPEAPEPELEEPIPEPEPPKPEEVTEKPKKGLFSRLKSKVVEKTLSPEDIDEFFDSSEVELMQADVAVEVIDFLKNFLKEKLTKNPIKRSKAKEFISKSFEEALLETVDQGSIDLKKMASKKKPLTIIFLGFNGSGKTTSIAKAAKWFQKHKLTPIFAAGDTFRAASIEQIEHHGEKLGIKTIRHKYGSDAAAVIYDARRHAETKGLNIVLADTAGRTHSDSNLMAELKKIVRVNKPDLKVLVVDSLTGNDAVEQAKRFHEAVGVDAVIMTKVDVNKKGGSILSVCYAIKKPILFIGVGQGYEDFKIFDPKEFVKQLIE